MRIISRYISSEILKLFLLSLAGLVTIYIGFTAATQLQQAAAGVVPVTTALKLIVLNSLIALEILLPTTLFFASVAVLARMQSDFETVIILSTGTTPLRLGTTIVGLALIIALLAGILSIFARPWAYKLSYQLESETIAELDIDTMAARQFIRITGSGHTLWASSINQAGGYAEDVFLQRDASEGIPHKLIIRAQLARLLPLNLDTPPVLLLKNGHMYRLDPDGNQDLALDFGQLRIPLPEEAALTEYRRKAVPTQLLAASSRPKDIAEYQWRLITPLLALVLAALAVPLTTTRPGQARSSTLVAAIFVYIVIFGATSVLRTAVEQSKLSATPGLWLAPVVPALLLLGYGMFLRYSYRVRGVA